jgi:hypothetical protein
MTSEWTNLVSALAAVFSATTAATAIFFTYRSERRSREVTKAQVYLTLRQNFIDIYRELGDLEGGADPEAQLRLARQAYWHHAFNEWYVSRLAPRELGDLWPSFFRAANASGFRHPALRETFDRMSANPDVGFGSYAKDFIEEVRQGSGPQTGSRPAVRVTGQRTDGRRNEDDGHDRPVV